MSATEAYDLCKFDVRILRRNHGGTNHAQVEGVLDFDTGVARHILVVNAGERFGGQHRNAHGGKVACDVVVDERVRMVRAACNHHGKGVLCAYVVEDLLAFFQKRGAVVVECLLAFGNSLVQKLLVELPVFVEPVNSLASAELGVEPVENRLVHGNAVILFGLVGILAHVRVGLHHGANGRCRELGVVTRDCNHHREEDAVDLLFNEAEHVAVHELCREANRVRGHAVEARFEHLVVALAAHYDGVAEACKEGLPEGERCPEFEHARNTDGLAVVFDELCRSVVLDQQLVRALDHVGHGLHLLVDFGDECLGLRIVRVGGDFAAFAAVTRHEALAVAEGHDGAGAMVGAVLAELTRLVVPAESLHGVKPDKAALEFRFGLALFFHELLGQKCDTDSAHFARTFGANRL